MGPGGRADPRLNREDWNARYAAAPLVWSAEPNATVAEEVAALDPGDALDLGCGEGRHARWLAGGGWHVTAVDFAGVALERGKQLAGEAGERIRWVEADIRTWQPPADSFDLAVIAFVHLPRADRQAMLLGAARALRPGGRLVLVGHDVTNLGGDRGGPQDPDGLYSAGEVVDLLPGLEVERAETVERELEPEHGGTQPAIDTVAVLRRPTTVS